LRHENRLLGVCDLSFRTDGLLGSPCTAVRIPRLDLIRGRILLVVGDRRHGKGALRSALHSLLQERGGIPGTFTDVRVAQPAHDEGTPREPITVRELTIAVSLSCVEATESSHLAQAGPETNILLSDDPAEPEYIVTEAMRRDVALLLLVDPDRVLRAVSAVAVHPSDFLWLRCGSPFVGPVSFTDFAASYDQSCDAYQPPTIGARSDIAGIVRNAMRLQHDAHAV